MALGKRTLLAQLLHSSGANVVLARAPLWQGLVVFNYHRIGEPDETFFDRGLFSATPEQFAAQVRYLTQSFNLLSISDLQEWEQRRGRFAMITFDDGYLDNYENAFPILRGFGATATFFITSGFLDEGRLAWWDEISWMVTSSTRERLPPNPWTGSSVVLPDVDRQGVIDRLLRIYKSLPGHKTAEFLEFLADACDTGRAPRDLAQPWMTWDHVREMHRCGMDIGAHTVSHPVLANLPKAEQDFEVRHCRDRIAAEIGRPVRAFSYPVGQPDSFNATTQSCLRNAGYEWAFSYYGGFNRPGACNRFAMRRVAIEIHTSPALFRCISCLPHVFA